jgi:hypothetical protein
VFLWDGIIKERNGKVKGSLERLQKILNDVGLGGRRAKKNAG